MLAEKGVASCEVTVGIKEHILLSLLIKHILATRPLIRSAGTGAAATCELVLPCLD